MSRRVERRFVNPEQISRHLICPICTDIFLEPTRLFCGHSFCKKCITHWTDDHNNCPICREEIQKKLMGKDLVADKIIQDLQVQCPNSCCTWKDSLEHLDKHYKNCSYTKSPEWLKTDQEYIKIEEDTSPNMASWSNIAHIKPIRPNPMECMVQNIPQASIFERLNPDVYYMTFIEKFYSGPSRAKNIFENIVSNHGFGRRRSSASGGRPLESFLATMPELEEEEKQDISQEGVMLLDENLRNFEMPMIFGESHNFKQNLLAENITSTKLIRKRKNVRQAIVEEDSSDDDYEVLLKAKNSRGNKRRSRKVTSQLPGDNLVKKSKMTLV